MRPSRCFKLLLPWRLLRVQLLPALLLCTALYPQNASAWGVLGCDFVGNVPAFIECVNNSSATAVNTAKSQLQQTIESLESSPLMAAPGFEAGMLDMARNADLLSVRQCLSNVSVELGSVVSNWLNSPVSLASGRVEHIFSQAFNAQRLAPLLQNIRTSPPMPGTLDINAQFDRAWQLMIHAANQDPVAKCGIPLIEAQKNAIRQTVTALYPTLANAANQQIETHFKPAMMMAMEELLQTRIQALRQGSAAPATQSPVRRAPQRQIRRAPADSNKRAAPAKRAVPPRTRAGETFLQDGARAAKEAFAGGARYVGDKAQELTEAAVPETLELIALGEFARQTLAERGLDEGTSTLEALNTALASGAPGSDDFGNLQRLVAKLDASNQRLYAHVGLAVIEYYGHEAIDSGGDFIIDVTLGSTAALERVVAEAAAVACSPGVMVSESGCSAVKSVIGFIYLQMFVPTAGYVIKEFVHAHWDDAMACGRQNIENPSIDGLNCGAFAALVGWLPKTTADAFEFAMPYLSETQQATLAYHEAVLALAQTAQNRAGRR